MPVSVVKTLCESGFSSDFINICIAVSRVLATVNQQLSMFDTGFSGAIVSYRWV